MTDKTEELWKKAFVKPTIIGEREIQMVGQDVAVVRNTEIAVEREVVRGRIFERAERVPIGDSYIDFVWLREGEMEEGEGSFLYEDENSIADGGFGVESAESLISQLQAAIFALKLRKP